MKNIIIREDTIYGVLNYIYKNNLSKTIASTFPYKDKIKVVWSFDSVQAEVFPNIESAQQAIQNYIDKHIAYCEATFI